MQESDRKLENRTNRVSSPVEILVCPRCGNENTRMSSSKTNDGILKILFYTAYRCKACRYRFSVVNPLRLIWSAGIAVLLIPVLGATWMASDRSVKIAKPVIALHQDQIKELAEKGDAEAELKMGLRHTSVARGVKKDHIAVQWFEKAAQHNSVEGQYRYGLALLNGQGTVQDYKTAFYWLDKAARQGHPLAQSTLGEMFYSGIAINKDIERAYLWFNLAAAQGVESVVTSRDIVVKMLDPNQIAALQQEASNISRGYNPSFVANESMTQINEFDPEDDYTAVEDEPVPVVTEPETKPKSLYLILKEWWKKDFF
jgi:uncharacterized protein